MFTCDVSKALSHAISLTVNYRLFAHSDVSYRFNGRVRIVNSNNK